MAVSAHSEWDKRGRKLLAASEIENKIMRSRSCALWTLQAAQPNTVHTLFFRCAESKGGCIQCKSCTQVSSSITMEIKGFKEALKIIEENGVKISTISTDRHSHTWHVAKGVSKKKLATAAKRRECEGLGEWIPSIINHLWCSV